MYGTGYYIQVTTSLAVEEKSIRQYPKAYKLYGYCLSLSLRQTEILNSRSKETEKTKNNILREIVDEFLEERREDRDLQKRLTEDYQEKTTKPAKSTFKLTGGS